MAPNSKNPAIEAAREINSRQHPTYVDTAYGVRLQLVPVSASLIDDVTSRVPDPEIPVWYNEKKERDEPNESDPNYLREMEEAGRLRGIAAMDAMIMFGVELPDGLPQEDKWLRKLKFMEKRGLLDLNDYDLDDTEEREFLFKRLVAVSGNLITKISELSGISGEEVERAKESFPGS